MAAKYYAWTNIHHNGKLIKKPGDEVSSKDVGEDFDALVEAKSIRTLKFPDDIPETWQGSPRGWVQEKRKRAIEAEPDMADFFDDATVGLADDDGVVLNTVPEGLEKPEDKK